MVGTSTKTILIFIVQISHNCVNVYQMLYIIYCSAYPQRNMNIYVQVNTTFYGHFVGVKS